MDVEEFVRTRIADGKDEKSIQKSLTDQILSIKKNVKSVLCRLNLPGP